MSNEGFSAKVFISCGQRKNTDETQIAREIGDGLTQLGYEPYIATEEQTLSGVKENIFAQIESSEYFLFVDFTREQIDQQKNCRGSLFSHQELAVASYLNMPVIAFQEVGVKQRDGLMAFLQSNAIPFTDRKQLPIMVVEEVKRRRWNPRWKNQLILERDPEQYVDAGHYTANKMARYFHITVRNLNQHKMARNCYAYLEHVRRLFDNMDFPVETNEFKWAGYILPNAVIGAGSKRRFDAFFVFHDAPNLLRFNVFSDSTEFIPRIDGDGDFLLTYVVVSENFNSARATFLLHVSNRLNEIRFAVDDGQR